MADLRSDAVLDLGAFIDASPSPFHAVAEAAQRLAAAGFVEIDERAPDAGDVPDGFVIRDGSIVAWSGLGGAADTSLRMIGAHTDSPNLRVKPQPEMHRLGVLSLIHI